MTGPILALVKTARRLTRGLEWHQSGADNRTCWAFLVRDFRFFAPWISIVGVDPAEPWFEWVEGGSVRFGPDGSSLRQGDSIYRLAVEIQPLGDLFRPDSLSL